jgi:hypothetical protein
MHYQNSYSKGPIFIREEINGFARGRQGKMKILVIPTTDGIRHPIPHRLNFILDLLTERHDVYVLHFGLKRFRDQESRQTRCRLVAESRIDGRSTTLLSAELPPSLLEDTTGGGQSED